MNTNSNFKGGTNNGGRSDWKTLPGLESAEDKTRMRKDAEESCG
jgi:hypothetical protein